MNRLLVVVCGLMVSSSPCAGQTAATSGDEVGRTVEVEWRQSIVTVFAPDLMLLIRSRSNDQVVVSVEWQARECKGGSVELSRRSNIFLAQLMRGERVYRSVLPPREWISLILPIGLTVAEGESESLEGCQSTVVVKAGVGDETEAIRFSVPLGVGSTEGDLPKHP